MQLGDRWHIVHNLAAALERMAVRVLAPLHKQHAADSLAKLDKQLKKRTWSIQGRIKMRMAKGAHLAIARRSGQRLVLPDAVLGGALSCT